MLGLKVNLGKSEFVLVWEVVEITELVGVLGCKSWAFAFDLFGIIF